MKNIIETVLDMGNFNTFVEAVKIAGLKDFLTSPRSLTVFVPQDGAFASIDKEELKNLLNIKVKLEKTLKLHIVSGKYTISDLIKLAEMKKEEKNKIITLNGNKISLSTTILCFCANDLKTVKLEKSTVIMPDIGCSNGILHDVDKVLMP